MECIYLNVHHLCQRPLDAAQLLYAVAGALLGSAEGLLLAQLALLQALQFDRDIQGGPIGAYSRVADAYVDTYRGCAGRCGADTYHSAPLWLTV